MEVTPGSALTFLTISSTIFGRPVIMTALSLTSCLVISLRSKLCKDKSCISRDFAREVRTTTSISFLQEIRTIHFSFCIFLTLFIIASENKRSKILESKTSNVPTVASTSMPQALSTPIDATHQSVAAVLRPLILLPFRKITPAPRKPMPDTTWAAMRLMSLGTRP